MQGVATSSDLVTQAIEKLQGGVCVVGRVWPLIDQPFQVSPDNERIRDPSFQEALSTQHGGMILTQWWVLTIVGRMGKGE